MAAKISIQAVLTLSLSAAIATAADPVVPPRLAVRPSSPGNLTPLNELTAGIDNLIESVALTNNARVEVLCDDATFLRRVSLDLLGEIPSIEEVSAFQKSNDPSKRFLKVQEMLKRPEYVERWSHFWTETFLGIPESSLFTMGAAPRLRQFIRTQMRAEKGMDAVAREILAGAESNPASVYLSSHLSKSDLPRTADHVARTFLGARIGCAQCHDHPFDKWTQQDFWGFASFLAYTNGGYGNLSDQDTRVQGEKYAPPSPEYELPARYLDGTVVDVKQPLPPPQKRIPRPMPMATTGGATPPAPRAPEGNTTGEKLRNALADLVLDRDDLRFDRAFANRMWAALFGRGLVHPIDDIRSRQNGAHDDILDLLSADFHASGRDPKRLLTLITSTQAYQRASASGGGPLKGAAAQAAKAERDRSVRYFARADVRTMTPHMLANALMRITAGEARYAALQRARAQEMIPGGKGTPQVVHDYQQILNAFRPANPTFMMAAEAHEDDNSFQRALMMMNADFMQRLIQDGTSRLRNAVQYDTVNIFAITLGRAPTYGELKAIEAQNLKRDALLWTIFNTAEFSSIH